MVNSHFFKVLTTFIVMILIGLAFLFFTGGTDQSATKNGEASTAAQ